MRKIRTKPKVINFEPAELKAPALLRCAAFLIDYVLVIFFPVLALVIGRILGNDGSKLLHSELSNIGWTLAILIAVTNLFILPLYRFQTIGKMVTGLTIVGSEGAPPRFLMLLFRHTVGYLVSIASFGVGFVMAFLSENGRALHDRMSRTYVIFAEQKAVVGVKDAE